MFRNSKGISLELHRYPPGEGGSPQIFRLRGAGGWTHDILGERGIHLMGDLEIKRRSFRLKLWKGPAIKTHSFGRVGGLVMV